MAQTTDPAQLPAMSPPDLDRMRLRVTSYEWAASLIISLLVQIAPIVIVLMGFALSRQLNTQVTELPVELVEEGSGRGDHPIGTGFDAAAPGVEDFAQVAEPNFEQLVQSLEGMLASDAALLDGYGLESVSGEGGLGDRRPAGPLGGNSDLVPRAERWDIAYSATTLEQYAAQLDHFGIELGVVGGGQRGVDYVSGFAETTPRARHVDRAEDDQRLYFTWRSGRLREFDRQLAERAGVNVVGRRILQFYPPEVENQLALAEQRALRGRALRTVRKTRFGVRPVEGKFEYYVIGFDSRN